MTHTGTTLHCWHKSEWDGNISITCRLSHFPESELMTLRRSWQRGKMDQFELDKMRWSPRSNPNKGPMRMLKFCVLGVCLPLVLLCVPLYMRFISLRPHLFTLSPLDMKLLNYEHRVSTIWCSKQTLRSVAWITGIGRPWCWHEKVWFVFELHFKILNRFKSKSWF